MATNLPPGSECNPTADAAAAVSPAAAIWSSPSSVTQLLFANPRGRCCCAEEEKEEEEDSSSASCNTRRAVAVQVAFGKQRLGWNHHLTLTSWAQGLTRVLSRYGSITELNT
jgi:hypothetical protein